MADAANAGNAETNQPQQNGSLGAPLNSSGAPLNNQPPVPAAPPAAEAASSAAAVPNLQDDIASILQGVKLPEREHPQNVAPVAEKKFDTALGAMVESAPAPTPPPAPKEGLVSVHTLRNDMHEVVEEQHVTRIRAAALEQEKRRPEPIDAEIAAKQNSPVRALALVVSIVALGILCVFGAYYYFTSTVGAPQNATTSTSLVFVEASKNVSLDGASPSAIKQQLAALRTQSGPTLGSITRIVPLIGATTGASGNSVGHEATLSEFMGAIGAHPPDELLRALSSTFFLGFHTIDKNAPVLVIPVVSYDRAFAGMLAWESTMNAELAPIFTLVPAFATAADGTVTPRAFVDDVIRNYDVRELKDDTGQIVLYYSFPTRSMLIIAESPYTFPEVISRLQAARQL